MPESFGRSLSARRAWIEILLCSSSRAALSAVALRKESVDRNFCDFLGAEIAVVALRKESVDRNSVSGSVCVILHGSLSARRAWIEMLGDHHHEKH